MTSLSDAYRLSLPPMPSGKAIRRADLALSRSLKGLCPSCGGPLDDEGRCEKERESRSSSR